MVSELPETQFGLSKKGLPQQFSSEESACKAGNAGLIPGSGKYPGEGNGNPLQYSGLGNSIDREAVHGVSKELDTTSRLNKSNSPENLVIFNI